MKGRKNLVSEKLDVKGKTTNKIMQWYYEDALIVNRKYQRKLVWSLEEKRLFIDSIINNYPTPSIIVSEYEDKNTVGKVTDYYEIIDGLQRLNAIVSFVNNDFGVVIDGQEYFFDMKFCPVVWTKVLRGEMRQKEPILDFDVCQDFSDAEIPVILATQRENRDEKIDKIFQRINSSGRKLSAHDIRQASSCGEFPDLVRRIATILRGDFTYYDTVNLCDMPKISLKNEGLNYGIDPDNIFWRRHDIIPFSNFRQSKDEELIASTMAIILLGKDFKVNADNLDLLYRPGNEYFDKLTSIIEKLGKDVLEDYAKNVIEQIDNIFVSVNSDFTSYLYPKKNSAAKDVGFAALFCALYRLNREHYKITDYECIAKMLKKYYDSTFAVVTSKSTNENRAAVTELLYNQLKQNMVKDVPRRVTGDEAMLEKFFSLSPVELQMIDFKIGITDFSDGTLNSAEIEKIWHTLVAMANTNCKDFPEGYVIVGVANSHEAYENWREVYGETSVLCGSHEVVGITAEAARNFYDEDHYELRIKQLVRNSLIREPLKEYILSNYRLASFHDKTLLLLPSTKQESISYYDNQYYVREGTSTEHKKDKDLTTGSMNMF